MASREKLQADFDLERFIDMFDEALTSNDERVINALRSLMMMVVLTKPEGRDQAGNGVKGPLRQLIEDIQHINRRLSRVEDYQERARYHETQKEAYKWPAQTANDWDPYIHNLGKTISGTGIGQGYDMNQMFKTLNSPKGK